MANKRDLKKWIMDACADAATKCIKLQIIVGDEQADKVDQLICEIASLATYSCAQVNSCRTKSSIKELMAQITDKLSQIAARMNSLCKQSSSNGQKEN